MSLIKCTPLAIICARRNKSRARNEDLECTSPGHGRDDADKTTQDGTLDVQNRPASRHGTGGWKATAFIGACLVATNASFGGVSANLVSYLTVVMHESNEAAAKNVSIWYGTYFASSILISFLADSYTGRFSACVIGSAISITGLSLITAAANARSFHPPQCSRRDMTCQAANRGQAAILYTGLYILDIGAGGILSTTMAFGADQFDEGDENEKHQKISFFNWNYVFQLSGTFITVTLWVYVQDNVSAGVSWGISIAVQALGACVLILGRRTYRYQKVGGNALVRIAQVLVAFLRKWREKVSSTEDLHEINDVRSAIGGTRKIQHTRKFRFLDKAALMTEKDKEAGLTNPWRICTITQVEEVKFLFSVLPIFCTAILFSTVYSQIATLFIEQGYSMDCKLGSFTIPAASIDVFETLSVFFCLAVYDRLLVPFLRKRTGNERGISELKRMGIGQVLSVLCMVVAALVEIRRRHTARDHGLLDDPYTPIPMSVFYLVPQYFIIGTAEVFMYVGLNEFFYDQAPDALRCLGTALALLTTGLGYYVGTLLLTIVGAITRRHGRPGWIADNLNRARIDLFYWLLAILSTISLFAFIISAHCYDYKPSPVPLEKGSSEVLDGTE